MMELKDFENFLDFTKKQITILKEKEDEKYKDDSWKNYDVEDLYDDMCGQLDDYDYSIDETEKQRIILHIANYAFFIHEKLKGS